MKNILLLPLLSLFLISLSGFNTHAQSSFDVAPANKLFYELIATSDIEEAVLLLDQIDLDWSDRYIPMALEAIRFARSSSVRTALQGLLMQKTGQSFIGLNDWYFWLWNEEIEAHPAYADFKASLYKNIDPRFETYFRDRLQTAQIRLDEVQWGGVLQDGIPPLRNPEMINAGDAGYLGENDVIFGIEINGDARAYPKRILAWHEMFTDTIGGEPIAGVYCTLCGTVIPYKTQTENGSFQLGTSGFLYRSNKLMYDQATQSLWSTVRGEPVIGPLVGQGIQLEHASVVTTTWNEWKTRHPDTTVLSLNTGHVRDYGEGVAYKEYFATDNLMFTTPFEDDRLDNKREVLALRFFAAPDQQLAIDTEFLKRNPIFEETIGRQNFVVLTDSSGANRVYDPDGRNFVEYDGHKLLLDDTGASWRVEEERLVAENGEHLDRLPYHRAFWFGWQAAFPETRLIK